MFDGLDSTIRECEYDDINTMNEWYDVVLHNAKSFLESFKEEDWEKLFKVLPYKSVVWQKRLCDCLSDTTNPNVLKALLYMSKTNDIELFSYVIGRLASYDASDIEDFDILCEKVEQNLDKVQGYYQERFTQFLEKKNRVR